VGVVFVAVAVAVVLLLALLVAVGLVGVVVRRRSRSRSTGWVVPVPAVTMPMTVIVLLTCTVQPPTHVAYLKHRDPASRLHTYRSSLAQWSQSGPLVQIVVVENSGCHRLQAGSYPCTEFVIFDEATDPDLPIAQPWFSRDDPSKGAHELVSVRTALSRSATIRAANPLTWVIKVTGRFFVPDLHKHLVTTPEAATAVAVRQRDPDRCQLLGARLQFADALFRGVGKVDMHMESEYKARLENDEWARHRVLVLPDLPIPVTLGGGDLTPFSSL
jgi:hypothetical protein